MKVMITGATEDFGLLLLKHLSKLSGIEQIIAVRSSDINYLNRYNIEDDEKLAFETAKNLRPRQLEDVFKKNPDIDVVVHLAYDNKPRKDKNNRFIHETNVFGTMRLLQLCEKYQVKKFIYKSPSSIYGAHPDNPVLIREDFPLRGNRSYQALRDKIEADIMCQLQMSKKNLPKIVIMRFCGIIGDHIISPLNTIFKQPFVPVIFGFDPMFQIIHEQDVVNALTLATMDSEIEGIFNISGKRTEPLTKIIKSLNKVPLPVSFMAIEMIYKPYFMKRREYTFPFDISYWKYPFAIDSSKAKNELGFIPKIL